MWNLSNIGRIFYGISIAGIGFPTVYYKVFPYMLLPPQFLKPGNSLLTYIVGALLIMAGIVIVLLKKTSEVSLTLGSLFLLIFCFFFIPFMFSTNSNYKHLAEWENAEKVLSLAGGAFIIAGLYSAKNKNLNSRFWGKLIPFGAILFSIPIISFGILHFQLAKDVATMVPSWIPFPLFWTYFAGTALVGSGIAIILKIRTGLVAALLGTMIFIWFITIHVPGVFSSSADDMNAQVTSAFLALADSGIAFVIAGGAKKLAN